MNRSTISCVLGRVRPFKSLNLKYLAILILAMLSLPFLAYGQNATIIGTVTDPSGAVVPNVTITITQVETARATVYTSNDAGEYVAPEIPIGHYNVKASATGFKVAERLGIVLYEHDRTRVDFQLQLGTTAQSVSVEANPIAVQTDTGAISDVITGRQVLQLATNGRSIYTLATLVPGASNNMTDDQAPSSTSGDNAVSYNGLRLGHNIYLMDGAESYDRGSGGKVQLMPSLDAVAEFNVMTSNYSAQYGLSSAGTVAMVFKSGGATIHASAWEFVRNDAFDAASYTAKAYGQKTPELRFNTFGFNIGGPVTFGHVYNPNKSKTFFFYNMEWRKLIAGGSINHTVPDTGTYGGVGLTGVVVPTLTAPALAALAAGGAAIPANLAALATDINAGHLTPGAAFPAAYPLSNYLDPNAQKLLTAGIFPKNNSTTGTPAVPNYFGGANVPTNIREELVRIDHHFNDKVSVFGHYAVDSVVQGESLTMWSDSNVPSVGTNFANPSKSATIHLMHTISPTLLNEIAYSYGGNSILFTPTGIFTQPSGLTIPGYFNKSLGLPNENTLNRIPGISLSGIATYDVAEVPWTNIAADNMIKDDLTWTKGKHELKMGFSWARYAKVQELFGNTQGEASFNGQWTGNTFADYLLGMDSGYGELALQDSGHWPNISYAGYIEDNWRATRRLTLNLGLRWDGIPHCIESSSRDSNFYPNLYTAANKAVLTAAGTIDPVLTPAAAFGASPNPVLAKLGNIFYLNGIGVIGKNGTPSGLVQNHWNNWGPRIGFAYDVTGSGKTIVRGGIGIMYERIQGNDMYNTGGNEPFSDSVNLGAVALSNPDLTLATGTAPVTPIPVPGITGLVSTDYKNPVSTQYSIGIQQQLGRESVLSIAYVGNQNRHQNNYAEINLPPESDLAALTGHTNSYAYLEAVPYTGFSSIKQSQNDLNSHYNGLQVQLRSRLKDLTFQGAFTWSRSIDAATGGDDLYTSPNPYNLNYGLGPSNLDRSVIGMVNLVYDLPFFRHSDSLALKTVAGGWQISAIGTMESGLPLYLGVSGSQSGNGVDNGSNRPDLTGSVSYPKTFGQWFTGAYALPALGAWGDAPAQGVRGPGRDNWNICLLKNFVISESRGSAFELRFESYNTFNHTQFKGVNTTYSNPANTGFGAVNSVWDPRVFQFGFKLKF